MGFDTALMLLPGLIIGLTFHEAAHAITAKWLGDRTAEKMGRVSLNPMKHLSPMGTLALFILGFGWGKPVIVNLYNFEKPNFYYLLSSLAGPAINLILSALALGILYMHPHWVIEWVCTSIFIINALLAVFNLLPVPPLDGSKIWPCLIPGMRPVVSGKWSNAWMVILVVCMFTGVIDKVITPVFRVILSLLP